MKITRKRWTDEEVSKLVYMNGKGYSKDLIAHELGRTKIAVAVKLSNLKNTAVNYDSEEMQRGDLILPAVCITLMIVLAVVSAL